MSNVGRISVPTLQLDGADEDVEGVSERRTDRRSAGALATATTFATDTSDFAADPNRDEAFRKRRRVEWARLLRHVSAVDVLRCRCGGEREIIAALTRF